MRRLRVLIACVALPVVLWAVLPVGSGASPGGRAASIQAKIQVTRAKIGRKKGAERVLSTDIAVYTKRIRRLQGRITALQGRQARLQSDLDAKRAELARIQERLRQERARLARLRARLVEVRRVLSERLVQMYKADQPDVVTVILQADGFADLLERSEFMRRVSDQDRRIMEIVRTAKADATATAARLDRLEQRQQRVTAAILVRRNEVAQVKQELVGTRVGFQRTRKGKQRALRATVASRRGLEKHLDDLEAEQARVLAALQNAQRQNQGLFNPSTAGPIRQGSGSFIWPVNGPITSGFGPRWGRLHAGIDISANGGTPIRAADSGKVVLLGWTGGYGNYTCIQHTATMSTCYAHQSGYATSNGASVRQGQVIGYVGNTGNSFGNHLHFEVRINGSPVNPLGYL